MRSHRRSSPCRSRSDPSSSTCSSGVLPAAGDAAVWQRQRLSLARRAWMMQGTQPRAEVHPTFGHAQRDLLRVRFHPSSEIFAPDEVHSLRVRHRTAGLHAMPPPQYFCKGIGRAHLHGVPMPGWSAAQIATLRIKLQISYLCHLLQSNGIPAYRMCIWQRKTQPASLPSLLCLLPPLAAELIH